jgi:hypothetical protein
MMLQIDGSCHDWLEGRGPYLTIVGAIDDATGEVPYCQFREEEDSQGYFLLLGDIILKNGLPLSLYSDRNSIFSQNQKGTLRIEEELKGEEELTQFGRALKELEIEIIRALSPQAKGRIERLWGTFQDRLVSELRLAGAKTMTEANKVLGEFLPDFNKRFAVEPKEKGSAYRPLRAGMKLSQVLCFKYERTVSNDNTVQFEGRIIQIPPGPKRRSYAKARVTINQGMDGGLGVYYQGEQIAYEKSVTEAPVLRVKSTKAKRKPGTDRPIAAKKDKAESAEKIEKREGGKAWRPAVDHIWRGQGPAAMALRKRQQ